jgi:hypothetical protein
MADDGRQTITKLSPEDLLSMNLYDLIPTGI